jgi:hypothetical protein
MELLDWLFKNTDCHGIKKCEISRLFYNLLIRSKYKKDFDRCVKGCICK